jgi:hypothetical protein
MLTVGSFKFFPAPAGSDRAQFCAQPVCRSVATLCQSLRLTSAEPPNDSNLAQHLSSGPLCV